MPGPNTQRGISTRSSAALSCQTMQGRHFIPSPRTTIERASRRESYIHSEDGGGAIDSRESHSAQHGVIGLTERTEKGCMSTRRRRPAEERNRNEHAGTHHNHAVSKEEAVGDQISQLLVALPEPNTGMHVRKRTNSRLGSCAKLPEREARGTHHHRELPVDGRNAQVGQRSHSHAVEDEQVGTRGRRLALPAKDDTQHPQDEKSSSAREMGSARASEVSRALARRSARTTTVSSGMSTRVSLGSRVNLTERSANRSDRRSSAISCGRFCAQHITERNRNPEVSVRPQLQPRVTGKNARLSDRARQQGSKPV